MSIKVIGVGDNVVDKYMHTKTMYPGGNAFNFSAYATMLGCPSSYMGVFGNDEAAAQVQATAKELGIDTSHCRIEEGENGYAMITLVDGDRTFMGSNKGGVAKEKPIRFQPEDLEYLSGFDLICTSINSHIDPELPKLSPLHPYVAYDFSIIETDERFDAVCPYIDFAITSCGDASLEQIKEKCARIHQRGCKYVIASRGKNGSVFSDGEHLFTRAANLVKAVDTLGAGDSFLTAFLLSFVEWLRSKPEDVSLETAVMQAMDAGSAFAAKTCMVHGAFGHGKQFE